MSGRIGGTGNRNMAGSVAMAVAVAVLQLC